MRGTWAGGRRRTGEGVRSAVTLTVAARSLAERCAQGVASSATKGRVGWWTGRPSRWWWWQGVTTLSAPLHAVWSAVPATDPGARSPGTATVVIPEALDSHTSVASASSLLMPLGMGSMGARPAAGNRKLRLGGGNGSTWPLTADLGGWPSVGATPKAAPASGH